MDEDSRPNLPWRLIVEWMSSGEACFREVLTVYYTGKTRYQSVDIVELHGLGKSLVLDGKIQSSLHDEHWYHEALVHPIMLAHPNPRRVLVIGGGEGATLREVLKHKTVERVVMVDIDKELVELSKRYLSEWHQGSFTDPRVEIVFSDGRKYVEDVAEEYDVVILDLVDPMEKGPATRLYTVEFYKAVKRLIGENGIMVTQATSPSLTPTVYAIIAKTLSVVFKKTRPYITYVKSYNGLWGFVAASDTHDPAKLDSKAVEKLISERIAGELRFYDAETHQWLFSLPKPVRKLLSEENRIATDDNPVYTPV